MDMNIGANEESDMYYYNRPIGWYIFGGTFALSMIITLGADKQFTLMGFAFAILWGIVVTTFGNILWALVGDIVAPYIHRDRFIYIDEGEEENDDGDSEVGSEIIESPSSRNGQLSLPNTSFQQNEDEFERQMGKVINDGKLWAKGMTILVPVEEEALRRYFKERWTASGDNINIPRYLGDTLVDKMEIRNLVNDGKLTTYGQRIIPWGNTYQRT